MENIIAKLVKIENAASDYAMKAEEELRNVDEKIKQRQEEIFREKENETQEKIKEIIDNMQSEVDSRLYEIEEKGAKRIASLNKQYSDNNEKWQDEILASIIQSVVS